MPPTTAVRHVPAAALVPGDRVLPRVAWSAAALRARVAPGGRPVTAVRSRSDAVPVGPLLDATAGMSVAAAAEVCGVSPRSINRWRSGATLTVLIDQADRIAIRLGVHLSELYPDLYGAP